MIKYRHLITDEGLRQGAPFINLYWSGGAIVSSRKMRRNGLMGGDIAVLPTNWLFVPLR